MRKLTALFLVLLGAYIVIGCGGSGGGSKGSPPLAATRDAVKQGFAHSLMGLAQAGMLGGASGTTGAGSTGSGGYAGGGFPMVGAFVYQFVPPAGGGSASPVKALQHRRAALEAATSGGTDGGGGGETYSFYYDDYLGLWVDMSWTDTSYTQLLYIDEAKSQPAGSFVSTFPEGWDRFPYQYVSTFEITAGSQAGAHGRYETVVESDTKGHSSFESVWPGYGSDRGTSTWDGDASSWSYESHYGELWWKGNGSFGGNGEGNASLTDSYGYHSVWTYHADGSGRGRVEGPDAGLPATIAWTASGHIKIVYADGSVEEWDPSDYFEEGGTTGTGTSGGSGAR